MTLENEEKTIEDSFLQIKKEEQEKAEKEKQDELEKLENQRQLEFRRSEKQRKKQKKLDNKDEEIASLLLKEEIQKILDEKQLNKNQEENKNEDDQLNENLEKNKDLPQFLSSKACLCNADFLNMIY